MEAQVGRRSQANRGLHRVNGAPEVQTEAQVTEPGEDRRGYQFPGAKGAVWAAARRLDEVFVYC